MIQFQVQHTDKRARVGILTTTHGVVHTPVFMPVGTTGSVKSLSSEQVKETGAQIILGNTYHLYLRPGVDVLSTYRGLRNFMHWDGPLLTDSGGFQVFSLSGGLTHLTEEGVKFKSHIDGSSHMFTPESSMHIQHAIGADIIMAFDEPVKDTATFALAKESSERTLRWLDRCMKAWRAYDPEKNQSLFGIVQGGVYKELRIESLERTKERNLEGIAIGGESIGYNKEKTREILAYLYPYLPKEIPHYTMGVGDIDDIFAVVEQGIDMFDCVSPTRLARNGALLISPYEGGEKKNKYRLQIMKEAHAKEMIPIDRTCTCFTCKNYTRGYLSHLFRSKELLAYPLASIHNLHMLSSICLAIREAIAHDSFSQLKESWVR